jgi:hypothetical protein
LERKVHSQRLVFIEPKVALLAICTFVKPASGTPPHESVKKSILIKTNTLIWMLTVDYTLVCEQSLVATLDNDVDPSRLRHLGASAFPALSTLPASAAK